MTAFGPGITSVDVTWQITETHSRRFTRDEIEPYLDEQGLLDRDDLETLVVDHENGDSYDHTTARDITDYRVMTGQA